MKSCWKKGMACFLVLALIAVLCLGCGDDNGGEEKVTIVVGNIIDLTGPASPAVIDMQQTMEDIVRYYNDEGLIPGVRLELVTYDDQFNPARAITAYEWCKERGAKVIWAVQSTTTDSLKPSAAADKVFIGGVSLTMDIADPPGWIFFFTSYSLGELRMELKWISEEHWGKPERIKVGSICWREAKGVEEQEVVREYCEAHPDKFEWVGGFTPPMGTQTFGGEVEELKGCDYIHTFGMAAPHFIKQFRVAGYDATFWGDSGLVGYYDFMVEFVGWEYLDGLLTTMMFVWYDEPNPAWDLIKEILNRYHPGVTPEDLIYSASGAFYLYYSFFEILQQTVEEVGAENFSGQACYDVAEKFQVQYDGLPQWGFSETNRILAKWAAVYEWSAQTEGMVRLTDWMYTCEE